MWWLLLPAWLLVAPLLGALIGASVRLEETASCRGTVEPSRTVSSDPGSATVAQVQPSQEHAAVR